MPGFPWQPLPGGAGGPSGWEPGLPGAAAGAAHPPARTPPPPQAPPSSSTGAWEATVGLWLCHGCNERVRAQPGSPGDPRHGLGCQRGCRGSPPSPLALTRRRRSPPGCDGVPPHPPHGPCTLSTDTGRAHEEEPERRGRARGAGEAAPGGHRGAPRRGWGSPGEHILGGLRGPLHIPAMGIHSRG